MSADTVHVEMELLQLVGTGDLELGIGDVRLYLGLCSKAFTSASASSLSI